MGLVGYSDSEGSDTEDVKPESSKVSTTLTTGSSDAVPKTKFEKVATGNKIRVNLPGASAGSVSSSAEANDLNNDRPAKRVKSSSAFSGINSFLPAPKNPGAKSSGSGGGGGLLSNGRGSGIGRGISLKTGAAPAFSRELPEVDNSAYTPAAEDGDYDEFGRRQEAAISIPTLDEQANKQEDVVGKPAARPMMFKPLSVSRKPTKKKPPMHATATTPSATSPAAHPKVATVHAPSPALAVGVTTPKPKQSLFSSYQDEPTPISEPRAHNDYQPEFVGTGDAEEPLQDQYETTQSYTAPPPSNIQAPTDDLQSLASTLNLTPAQRRQLFGRGDTSSAKLTNFNLAQEYSANNQLMQDDANAPVHNPVRSIAPGKHSLQQLVNQAANQRDALEESFASNKRNKAAAGSKYGW